MFFSVIIYFGEFTFIVVIFFILLILGLLGIIERSRQNERISRIPLRIHVNGIRGKSTVTRLIGAGLRAGGYKTLTRTTGKAARVILWDGREIPLKRKGRPNIREQMRIMDFARRNNVDALVVECMAIQPELQNVCEKEFIRSRIGVITNIRADHLDAMGPTLKDVTRNLCSTIPEKGFIVTSEKTFLEEIKREAEKRNANVIFSEPEKISNDVINRFSYLNFKENVSVALTVCRLAGIDEDTAMEGMLTAEPDYGHVRIYCINNPANINKKVLFVNAMGVNDKDSTAIIYNELRQRGYFDGRSVIGFFHARGDRVTRTLEFGRAMVKEMKFEKIAVAGKFTKLFLREAVRAGCPPQNAINMGFVDGEDVMRRLLAIADTIEGDAAIFSCGNMVGDIPEKILSTAERIGSEGVCL